MQAGQAGTASPGRAPAGSAARLSLLGLLLMLMGLRVRGLPLPGDGAGRRRWRLPREAPVGGEAT
jgi:hypothetical protein